MDTPGSLEYGGPVPPKHGVIRSPDVRMGARCPKWRDHDVVDPKWRRIGIPEAVCANANTATDQPATATIGPL